MSGIIPALSLGLLAGGRASRLGGADKAWAVYRGQALIERTLAAVAGQHPFAACFVSANRSGERYAALGLQPVPDRIDGFPGPLAGIDALLAACTTPLLLTVPVDLRLIPHDLVAGLLAAGEGGAVAHDASGLQPLVALWPVGRARVAVAEAFAGGQTAVHRVVNALALPSVRFADTQFDNLNTPDDFST
ncbi:MAG: NTP transferase domain-containing protein [Proteobacteria bacterium]|nr:NTP transferase domain-containing protein [Pseudomonadota bacterium]MBS0463814.1 NTP transferase domain-containing protein [Pseudomonadota bacterium]